MLRKHLLTHALHLDEPNYHLIPADSLIDAANSGYSEDYQYEAEAAAYWYRYFRTRFIRAGVRLRDRPTVLECAAGGGRMLDFISTMLRPSVACFTELSANQLTQLCQQFARLPTAIHAGAQQADVCALPFRNETFDLVVGNSFLHHIPSVPSALVEMHRVLQEDGVLLLFHEPTVSAPFWESFPLSLIKNTAHDGFADLWLFTIDDLARLLQKAGFYSVYIYPSGLLNYLFISPFIILLRKIHYLHVGALRKYTYILQSVVETFETSYIFSNRAKPYTPSALVAPSVMVAARKSTLLHK